MNENLEQKTRTEPVQSTKSAEQSGYQSNSFLEKIDEDLKEIDSDIDSAEKTQYLLEGIKWQLKGRVRWYDVIGEIGKKCSRCIGEGYRTTRDSVGSGCRSVVDSITYKNMKLLAQGIYHVSVGALKGAVSGFFLIPSFIRKRSAYEEKSSINNLSLNEYIECESYFCSGNLVSGLSGLFIPYFTILSLFVREEKVLYSLGTLFATNAASGLYELGRKVYVSNKKDLEEKVSDLTK